MMALILILCQYSLSKLLLSKLLLPMPRKIKMWSLLCSKKIIFKTRTML
jgi:hypothetical protein